MRIPYLALGRMLLQKMQADLNLSELQCEVSSKRNLPSASEISKASIPFSPQRENIHISLNTAKIDSVSLSTDIPLLSISWRAEFDSFGSIRRFFTHFSSSVLLPPPVSILTLSSVRFPCPSETACSVSDRASRSAPSACLEISHTASMSACIFSDSQTKATLLTISAIEILWKGICWHLDLIVTGTL